MLNTLFVVGLGNIGSQLVPLLGAAAHVGRIGLVDFDTYEPANLHSQRITPRDVGRPKARAQARVLRALRPDLAVEAHVGRFEHLPLGMFRNGVIFSCVDARAARQQINRVAVALGCVWIDAGIGRDGSVRARTHFPGSACLECAWGEADYALLESRAPCEGAGAAATPTAAPVELGAIAAGLQMALYRRLVTDSAARDALADRQCMLDVASNRAFTARYQRNAGCRQDHGEWPIEALPPGSTEMSLRDALALAGAQASAASLAAPGMAFIRRLRCTRCDHVRRVQTKLSGRLAPRLCATCGTPLQAAAIDTDDELSEANAGTAVLRAPLARRGFVGGDIVAVRSGDATRFFQLA